MPSAELIAIGTELLLGEILDTNTHFLARTLREQGIDLYRTTIIGDTRNVSLKRFEKRYSVQILSSQPVG
jgi:nicotinamide-nucleotide amidase